MDLCRVVNMVTMSPEDVLVREDGSTVEDNFSVPFCPEREVVCFVNKSSLLASTVLLPSVTGEVDTGVDTFVTYEVSGTAVSLSLRVLCDCVPDVEDSTFVDGQNICAES